MNLQDLKTIIVGLFPLKTTVSQHTLDHAPRYDVYDCIGARTLTETLRKVLPKETHSQFDILWSTDDGTLRVKDNAMGLFEEGLKIGNNGGLNLMKLNKPTEIEFILLRDGRWDHF